MSSQNIIVIFYDWYFSCLQCFLSSKNIFRCYNFNASDSPKLPSGHSALKPLRVIETKIGNALLIKPKSSMDHLYHSLMSPSSYLVLAFRYSSSVRDSLFPPFLGWGMKYPFFKPTLFTSNFQFPSGFFRWHSGWMLMGVNSHCWLEISERYKFFMQTMKHCQNRRVCWQLN